MEMSPSLSSRHWSVPVTQPREEDPLIELLSYLLN